MIPEADSTALGGLQWPRAELTARFILEARATARCSHENIVVIHEVGEHGGNPFMVLEYLQGGPLTRLLQDGRKLPPAQAVELAVPVVRALTVAHAHNIAHRDLKPDNIFVTDAGTVKVRERLAFTACLAGMCDDATTPLRLVLSLRSDFLDHVAESPALLAEASSPGSPGSIVNLEHRFPTTSGNVMISNAEQEQLSGGFGISPVMRVCIEPDARLQHDLDFTGLGRLQAGNHECLSRARRPG